MEIMVCGLRYLLTMQNILVWCPIHKDRVTGRCYGCLQSACFSRGPNVRMVRLVDIVLFQASCLSSVVDAEAMYTLHSVVHTAQFKLELQPS